jgi:hypothetical protein
MYIGGTSSQSASATTLYYVYLINVSGTTYLDLETTGHATDGTTGIEIMSGNDTRTLVGMIYVDSSTKVSTQGQTNVAGDTNTVATWDNRIPSTTVCGFTTNRSISTNAITEINSENRCHFMSWGDALQLSSNQDGTASSSPGNLDTYLEFESGTPGGTYGAISPTSYPTSPATIPAEVQVVAPLAAKVPEGYHYTRLLGAISTGTFTYLPDSSTTVFNIQ